jgi:heme/copper-type cytochrome/quinol oxidase subunit 3
VVIRLNGRFSPDLGAIHTPPTLWLSTAILLCSSAVVHQAVKAVQRERQERFKAMMLGTFILSLMFVLVQGPALYTLLQQHFKAIESLDKPMPLYGAVFCLIFLHAMHVIGGMIPLAVTTYKAHQGVYDHEHYNPVRYLALYWHFLDVVWIVMFMVMFWVA